jgi:hydroxymethylpyrimidine pyrophosphatase-like HAD family hydrolase
MLEIAGYPVLMGNAPLDLHEMAAERGWFTTGPHDADGVAEAIYAALPELELATVEGKSHHG